MILFRLISLISLNKNYLVSLDDFPFSDLRIYYRNWIPEYIDDIHSRDWRIMTSLFFWYVAV